jgi:hypothetical protein
MKILKKILIILCNMFLLLSVFLGVVSYVATNAIREGISSVVNDKLSSIPGYQLLGFDSEKLSEFIEKEETMTFILEHINPMLGDEVDINSIDLSEDIYQFVEENKSELEEITGQEINMLYIRLIVESPMMQDVNAKYIDTITETTGNVPVEVKNMVYAYGFFFTDGFRIAMIVLAFVSILGVILIERSYHKWLKSVGGVLLGSGIMITISVVIGSMVIQEIFKSMELPIIEPKLTSVYIIACGLAIVGLGMIIVYNIVEKRIRERSILNEISQISPQQ